MPKWYDRRDFVFVEFCVEDSKDVHVQFDKSKFEFSCVSRRDKYYNDIELFGEIDPKQSKHSRTDRSVQCCLQKAEVGKPWPRLTKEKAKMMNNMGGDDLPDFDGAEEVSYVYYFLMISLKFTR
uniref:Prostaglandin E synthase 3 n=1 Tax=Xiphophorus couchianus TaxID=32473 RepID=A0A3B5LFS6_9TELE